MSLAPPVAAAARKAAKKKAKKKKKPRAKKQATVKKVCRKVTKKIRGRKRKVKVCKTVKVKPKAKKKTSAKKRTPVLFSPAAPPLRAPAAPAAPPAPSEQPVPVFTKAVGERHVERLLWRAGFGPAPGQVAALAAQDLQGVVHTLTRPGGAANLVGPAARDDNGNPLQPGDIWGHDHCAWLDRMVRSDQPLVERMALIWHDWFATSGDGVDTKLMLDQIQLFRDKGLGSFDELFSAVTVNPAMLVWLNGDSNNRWNVNENYAREMMELFSLGADRGAYTETDVREMARALTGWRSSWADGVGHYNFRYDANFHDKNTKTVFGRSGNFDWQDAVRLCVEHPLHASFFCTKLWSYFCPDPPDDATLASLQGTYLGSGRQIRPVVEAILMHPAVLDGPSMVVPPIVYNAGLLRALGRGIDTTAWAWLAGWHGQRLFFPPNVAGWDDTRWLDTSTMRGRWWVAQYALAPRAENPWPPSGSSTYDPNEDAATAVTRAMDLLGRPSVSADTQQVIAQFASTSVPADTRSWNRSPYRAMRQNALRMLLATCPDRHVC